MNTDKRTIKNDMDSNQITNIKKLSYLLSVLSVSIGGNLFFANRLTIFIYYIDCKHTKGGGLVNLKSIETCEVTLL